MAKQLHPWVSISRNHEVRLFTLRKGRDLVNLITTSQVGWRVSIYVQSHRIQEEWGMWRNFSPKKTRSYQTCPVCGRLKRSGSGLGPSSTSVSSLLSASSSADDLASPLARCFEIFPTEERSSLDFLCSASPARRCLPAAAATAGCIKPPRPIGIGKEKSQK